MQKRTSRNRGQARFTYGILMHMRAHCIQHIKRTRYIWQYTYGNDNNNNNTKYKCDEEEEEKKKTDMTVRHRWYILRILYVYEHNNK